MIRTVGNTPGNTLDPAGRTAGGESRAGTITAAGSLAALKVRAGTAEAMPTREAGLQESLKNFAETLGLKASILSGDGAGEKASLVETLRLQARGGTTTGEKA